MKILQNVNIAAHYRTAIYMLMDKELECDFCFGDDIGFPLKKMDYSLIKHKVTEVHNRQLAGGWYWQIGVPSLLKEEYDRYIFVGEVRCLSTWVALIMGRFYKNKKTYVWSHGWYGKENWLEKELKKLFFSLPTGGIFLYGNYARELMIKERFNPEKLFVIHNSLDYDRQLILRSELTSKTLYKEHFGNDYPNLFFVGRLTKVKQLDMVLRAVALLRDKGEFYNMTFIGEGEVKGELESIAYELSLEKQVWFYGACYDEKILGEMIYNADLCVAPGNIGLTAMHSLVFGTPAITHDDFSHQMPEFEAIRNMETGTFFKRGDIHSLAEGISRWFIEKSGKRDDVRNSCFHEIDTQWTPQFQINVLKKHLI